MLSNVETTDPKVVELLDRGLPKWPQHYVTGQTLQPELAKEIIRRTDSFFAGGHGGNNHDYDRWVRKMLGMPCDWLDLPKDPDPKTEPDAFRAFYQKRRVEEDAFRRRWHTISTQYVHNSWVSCAFVGGPYGWCHPDGEIGFIDNVGKWPSVRDVFSDWTVLAEAFPFLNIGVTLFYGEECEEDKAKVVSFRVLNGLVEVVDPKEVDVHAGHPKARRRADSSNDSTQDFIKDYSNPRREQGLPDEWIEEWARAYPKG